MALCLQSIKIYTDMNDRGGEIAFRSISVTTPPTTSSWLLGGAAVVTWFLMDFVLVKFWGLKCI